MRKVILNVAISLDGYIEDTKGAYDWCFTDQDYGMTDFLSRIDAVFMGRASYELVCSMDEPFFPDKQTYVFSRTGKPIEGKAILLDGELTEEVDRVRKGEGKDIWLFGGAALTESFLQANLVDEMWLAVHPILLGGGKPFFGNFSERKNLRLLGTKPYSSGLVQLFYGK